MGAPEVVPEGSDLAVVAGVSMSANSVAVSVEPSGTVSANLETLRYAHWK